MALLVPEPVAAEVDGLRRALGDGALGRIPAHLTLVPPVNVALDRLDEAADVLRAAAAASGPLRLEIGPPVTFWPVTPVVYLAVTGDLEGLHGLRERVFREPLARPLTYEFVPHVTLADEVAPGRIPAAVEALSDYRRGVSLAHVHLLREGAGRIWEPIAEATLGPPRVVGRGGLPVELSVSAQPDAVVPRRLGAPASVVVTARRQGQAVGLARALLSADEPGAAWLVGLDVAAHAVRTGIGAQLLGALCAELAERGVEVLRVPSGQPAVATAAPGPEGGFLAHMGFRPGPGRVLERHL